LLIVAGVTIVFIIMIRNENKKLKQKEQK